MSVRYPRQKARAASRRGIRCALPGSLLVVCALALHPAPVRADPALASGDSAWARGDYVAAGEAYRRALAADSGSVRATFRLGLMASWNNQLDSSLALIRRARALDPSDLDIRIAEARVLSWDGRTRAAIAVYDSVLTGAPESREAGLGRAQSLTWAGRLEAADSAFARVVSQHPGDAAAVVGRAEVAVARGDRRTAAKLYRDLLARDPDNQDALTGMARVLLLEGRNREAKREVARVLEADPTHRQARALDREIDASLSLRLETALLVSEDSDHNLGWSESASSTIWLASGLSGFASAGALEASDPSRRSSRRGGETGLVWASGDRQLTAAVGAHELRPEGVDPHSLATARAVVSQRLGRSVSAALDWSHTPLDETALLIGRNLRVDAYGASLDAGLGHAFSLSLALGGATLSDQNRRTSWVASLERPVALGTSVALMARQLAYHQRGQGYFSPDRFSILDVRAIRAWGGRSWTGRLQGGLGAQQTARDAPGQFEWHLEARCGKGWSSSNHVDAVIGLSDSGLNSTSGAYRSRMVGLSVSFAL